MRFSFKQGSSIIVNMDQLGCVMKKLLVIFCAAILALGVAGCAGKGKAPILGTESSPQKVAEASPPQKVAEPSPPTQNPSPSGARPALGRNISIPPSGETRFVRN